MSLTRGLDLQKEINHLLMLRQPLLRRQFEGAFNERHIEARFMGRAPGWTGVGRQDVLAIHLCQCPLVNHNQIFIGSNARFTTENYAAPRLLATPPFTSLAAKSESLSIACYGGDRPQRGPARISARFRMTT
jgi:hypothetical protein